MPPTAKSNWIVAPSFDAAFLANSYWPLVLLPGLYPVTGGSELDFWQVYFLTTPHRWITLALVSLDPDRRAGRTRLFAALAVLAAMVVAAGWFWLESLACLLLVDFVWNAWHFASQHAGILRMYSRKAGGGRPRWESYGLRAAVFYALLRLPYWSIGWLDGWSRARTVVALADGLMLGLLAALLLVELLRPTARSLAKVLYLSSVASLYGTLLIAVHFRATQWVVPLAAAATLVHAVEYLAFVTHYAQRRADHGTAGLWQIMTRNWLLAFGAYLLTLGLLGWAADAWLHNLWIALNLWAAYLHYAFDGMIWKLRRAETAAVLDVRLPATVPVVPEAPPPRTKAAWPVGIE